MSEPLSETCFYCGSPDVMDDAWWCEASECWDAYYREEQDRADYEARTPLTRTKADSDLWSTNATVWGPMARTIECAAAGIAKLAKAPVR
jgi:hypothetical protein